MKIKLQEKLIALLLVFAMVFLTVPLAKADIIISLEENEETENIGLAVANSGQMRIYSFDVWYSNTYNIGYWPTIPCLYNTNIDSIYGINSAISNAANGWSNALGISISTCNVSPVFSGTEYPLDSNYPLHFFSGKKETLIKLDIFDETSLNNPDNLGSTAYKSYTPYTGAILENGTYRNYWKLYKVRCYVKEITQVTNVSAHELGHALGWHGHSNNSSDLMYEYANSRSVPQQRDKTHLKQIYDLFH